MGFIRLAFGLMLLTFLIYLAGPQAILNRILILPVWFVPFGLFYYLLCQIVSTKRWQLVLEAHDVKTRFGRLFHLYMIGMFANNFLPGAVGGDAVKAAGIYREDLRSGVAIASVLVERFLGLAALGTLGLVASVPVLIQYHGDPVVLLATVGTAVAIVSGGVIVWFPPIADPVGRWLNKAGLGRPGVLLRGLFEAVRVHWAKKRLLFIAFFLSVVVQLMIGFYYVLAALATGLELPFIYFFAFLPAITLVSMAPISIGGLGVREITMIFLFTRVGASSTDILTISLIIHALNSLLSLVGGAMLLREYFKPKIGRGGGKAEQRVARTVRNEP